MAGADFDSIGRPQEFDFDTAEEFILEVPANRLFEIFAVAFRWVSTGTVGNRLIFVRMNNRNGQPIYTRQSRLIQVASQTIQYVWAPGMPDETATVPNGQLLQPMPLLSIEEGGSISIADDAEIQPLDTLIGSISARIYKAE